MMVVVILTVVAELVPVVVRGRGGVGGGGVKGRAVGGGSGSPVGRMEKGNAVVVPVQYTRSV